MTQTTQKNSLEMYYKDSIGPKTTAAPYILRLTEWKDYPAPVLVIKERRELVNSKSRLMDKRQSELTMSYPSIYKLYDISHISGESLRRCITVIKQILSSVKDDEGIPFELQRFMSKEGLKLRLNLPLDETAGGQARAYLQAPDES